MTLESVMYVSSATGWLSDMDLEGILTASRQRNDELGVTGALLYHDGSFCQYFEGPHGAVDVVYEHIRRSKLHQGILELDRVSLQQRQFSAWQMGLTHAPKSQILALANARWHDTVLGFHPDAVMTDGLTLLLEFWRAGRDPGRAAPMC